MWHRKRMVQLWDSSYKGRCAWRSALQLWNNFYSSQPVEECVLTDTHRGLRFSFPSQKRSKNYFLRGTFSNQCYTLGDGRKWASGIHGLSLSSLISPGALDKQDFTSLMQRVRIKAFLSEAHWVFTHPLIVKVLFSHGQFVLRLLFPRLQQNASQPTVENCKVQYMLYMLPLILLQAECKAPLWSLLPQRDQRTWLPAKQFILCLPRNQKYTKYNNKVTKYLKCLPYW